jgi:hypothetical protein
MTPKHDHAGAGAERGHPLVQALLHRVEQVEDLQEAAHRGGLPAGDDEAVHGVEFGGAAHRDRPRARGLERAHVVDHVALQGEHADQGHGHHRTPSRSSGRAHQA